MIFPQIENLCVIVKFVGFTNGASINHEHKIILWLNSRILITVGYLFIPTKHTQMFGNGKNIIFMIFFGSSLLFPHWCSEIHNSYNIEIKWRGLQREESSDRNQICRFHFKDSKFTNNALEIFTIFFSILISFFHWLWRNI